MLYRVLETASTLTDEVLVGYSGGKDSAVTLDLCCRYFRRVEAFFMYLVPGLSFQERVLKWAEEKYGITIHRLPHFEVSNFMRYGLFHVEDPSVPIVSITDMYAYLRDKTGIYWIAAGERIADSIIRRAMITKNGTIDQKRGRIYPLAYWNKEHVLTYIRTHRLVTSPEARVLGHSFRSFMPEEIAAVKRLFPEDYERIRRYYPLVEASVRRYEFYGA